MNWLFEGEGVILAGAYGGRTIEECRGGEGGGVGVDILGWAAIREGTIYCRQINSSF